MKIVFLYPGRRHHDALLNWAWTLVRHATKHQVATSSIVANSAPFDLVLLLTQSDIYPRSFIDSDIRYLQGIGKPFAVIHNEHNPGVSTPGNYQSFCWTKLAADKLAAYRPTLVRQPCLVPPSICRDYPAIRVGTIGHIEPKKRTLDMAKWAKAAGLPFTAVAPDTFAKQYDNVISLVRRNGAEVRIHPWRETFEDMEQDVTGISHFLFVLPPSKGGAGGSPTSPHYATWFGRPVLVVDDENTLAEDGINVFSSLGQITADSVRAASLPSPQMTVDRYLDTITECMKL